MRRVETSLNLPMTGYLLHANENHNVNLPIKNSIQKEASLPLVSVCTRPRESVF